MRFSMDDLSAALRAGILDAVTFDRLTGFLAARAEARPPEPAASAATPPARFDLAHLLWYAGALIVMSGMGVFTTLAFSALGGTALALIGLVYAAGFTLAGQALWTKGLTTPGGLMIAIAVSMAPLVVFGIQDQMHAWNYDDPAKYRDFFKYINGSFLWMEVAAIVAAVVALRFFPFGFISLIAAVALWFMSMDIVAWLKSPEGWNSEWELRRQVSMVFGLAMILIAWSLDLKRDRRTDYGFWLHLFGIIAFWGAVTATSSSSEMGKALYCALNVGLLFFSVYIGRRVYAVFGTIGIATYLGHLAYEVFKDALGFTFALTLIGIGVIWLGLVYHRRQTDMARWFDRNLPQVFRALRPPQAP